MKYLVLCYYDVKQFESLTEERRQAMFAECKARDMEFKNTGKVDFVASQSDPATSASRGAAGPRTDRRADPALGIPAEVGHIYGRFRALASRPVASPRTVFR